MNPYMLFSLWLTAVGFVTYATWGIDPFNLDPTDQDKDNG